MLTTLQTFLNFFFLFLTHSMHFFVVFSISKEIKLWPYPRSRGIWIGSMTPLLLPLDTKVTWPPLPLQEITASLPATRRIRRPKTPLARSHVSYGRVGERKCSLGQPPIRILRPGRLEVGLSVRQQPIEIQHPKRLAQRPGLGQWPIIIQHSRRLTQRPGWGQRPMIIRRSLEIGLESAGQGRVPKWSIPGPSCAHSIPDSGPITIQNADLTWTTLNSGVYINRPSQASNRIQLLDLVETPSPDLASPHLLFSDLMETPSLDRPLGI